MPAAAAAKSLQSCPTLCDPIDVSPRGSPVPGVLQARTLTLSLIFESIIWVYFTTSGVSFLPYQVQHFPAGLLLSLWPVGKVGVDPDYGLDYFTGELLQK